MAKLEVVGAAPVHRATLEAKVIRADGTVEDLGVIADSGNLWESPPSLLQRLKEWLCRN